jgi:ribulose-phosphate 3-epimerase
MSVEVIPAVLPRSLKDLTAHLERVRGVSRKVQVDIVGGGFFTFNRTWPFRDRGSFKKILKEEQGLPHWTEFDTEVDLMVDNPKELALQFVRLRTARVIVHAVRPGAFAAAQALADYDDDDHPFPVGVGVAVGVEDPLDILEPYEHLIDFVQVMGIATVGYQGRSFDERALTQVARLRRRYPQMAIQVDGGVSLKNARALVQAGATSLIAGSAVFGAKDASAALKALYTEANGV